MSIYIFKNNQQFGPFEESEVRKMLGTGQFSPDDQAIRQGDGRWQPLKFLLAGANVYPAHLSPGADRSGSSSGGTKLWLAALGGVAVFGLVLIAGAVGLFVFLKNGASITAAPPNGQPPVKNEPPPRVMNVKGLQAKAEELARLSPPKKIETRPLIKGRVAIVEKGKYEAKLLGFDYEGETYSDTDLDKYGISKIRLAVSPDEIDTLQILCGKGKLIGYYEGGIAGYANDCTVSVIDYRSSAVVAQENFTNSTPPPKISSVYEDEYIFPEPDEVADYVGSFPLEKMNEAFPAIPFDDRDGYYGKYKPFMDLSGELSRIVFPDRLEPNAAVKGKLAVALKTAEGRTELKGFDVYGKEISYDAERWGVADRLAEKIEDVDTLIQINCRKGRRLGAVKKTAVFANQCVVSVVDYRAGAVVFRKEFENAEMRRDVNTEVYPNRYVVLYPMSEIDDFIKSLPKN